MVIEPSVPSAAKAEVGIIENIITKHNANARILAFILVYSYLLKQLIIRAQMLIQTLQIKIINCCITIYICYCKSFTCQRI